MNYRPIFFLTVTNKFFIQFENLCGIKNRVWFWAYKARRNLKKKSTAQQTLSSWGKYDHQDDLVHSKYFFDVSKITRILKKYNLKVSKYPGVFRIFSKRHKKAPSGLCSPRSKREEYGFCKTLKNHRCHFGTDFWSFSIGKNKMLVLTPVKRNMFELSWEWTKK